MGMRLGKAFIKANGQLLETMPGAKLDLGGAVRTPVVGSSSVHGFAEQVRPAKLECEISVGKDTKLLDHAKWTDLSVTFECDTGQVFVIRSAFSSEPPVITEGEGGKVPVVFFGQPAEPVN